MDSKAIEARRQYLKNWQNQNRERRNAYHKEWRKNHPDKVKEYNERYWDKKAAATAE